MDEKITLLGGAVMMLLALSIVMKEIFDTIAMTVRRHKKEK